ncbi:MAG TPA: phosphate signaling complex protein PhoU [Herpetosiphonaceae bacterium]
MGTRQTFEHQLDELYEGLFRIGTMVEGALGHALAVIDSQNDEQAQEVVAGDSLINRAVYDLHDQALLVIATQQPMARDLRLISVVISMLPELERMADHAATICKLQRRMMHESHYLPLEAIEGPFPSLIREMGLRTAEILHAGLDAIRQRDRGFADRVVKMDDVIDNLYSRVFRATVELARTHPDLTDEAIHLLTLAHNLERIGDRVTNLAEQIVFLLTGEVVELNY